MPAAFSQLALLMTSFEVQSSVMQISWLHIQCAGSHFAKSFKASGSEGKIFMKTFRIIGSNKVQVESGTRFFCFLLILCLIIFKVHLMLCKMQAMIMVLGVKFQVQLEGFLMIKVQYHHDNMFVRK